MKTDPFLFLLVLETTNKVRNHWAGCIYLRSSSPSKSSCNLVKRMYSTKHNCTYNFPPNTIQYKPCKVIADKVLQGACKYLKYFAKPDDRCILYNEIVHTTFGSTSQEDHDVQIAVGTRVEPQQIPGHTNCSRSVRQPFPSNTGLRFSREMAVATIEPFQMLRSLCVIDTNFTMLRHFLLKILN
jgi:hypothetical protein